MAKGRRVNLWRHAPGAMVYVWLRPRNEISMGAKILYGTLSSIAGPAGWAYASQPQLAEYLGVDERTIKRYVRELTEHDLIEIDRMPPHNRNHYFFLAHPWMGKYEPEHGDILVLSEGTELSPPTGQNCPGTGGKSLVGRGDNFVTLEGTGLSPHHNKEETISKTIQSSTPGGHSVQAVTPIAAPGVSKSAPNKYVQELRSEAKRSQEDMAEAVAFVGAMDPMEVERLRREVLSMLPERMQRSYEGKEVLQTPALLSSVYTRALAESNQNNHLTGAKPQGV